MLVPRSVPDLPAGCAKGVDDEPKRLSLRLEREEERRLARRARVDDPRPSRLGRLDQELAQVRAPADAIGADVGAAGEAARAGASGRQGPNLATQEDGLAAGGGDLL